jgi:hypothetical protein
MLLRRVRKTAKSDGNLRHVCVWVCSSVRVEQLGFCWQGNGGIFMKFDIWVFSKPCSENVSFIDI